MTRGVHLSVVDEEDGRLERLATLSFSRQDEAAWGMAVARDGGIYVSTGAIDPEGARWAGDRRRQLRAQGRRGPLGDALIAALAWRMEATVVTRNPRDFEPFGVPVLGYGEPPQASAGTKRGSTS